MKKGLRPDLLSGSSQAGVDDVATWFAEAYPELLERARGLVSRESACRRPEPHGLVHEAYLRLASRPRGWSDVEHFLAYTVCVMEHVLCDRGRSRGTIRRGGDVSHVALATVEIVADEACVSKLELRDALDVQRRDHPRWHRALDLRHGRGACMAEVASDLCVSIPVARRLCESGACWLRSRLC